MTATLPPAAFLLILLVVVVLVGSSLGLVGCGSTADTVPVDVPHAPRVSERVQVAYEVGRLLGSDSAASKAAGQRLMALDGEARTRFLAYVERLQGERDPRLLNVLDEQHALPTMAASARLDFLLWKASLPDRFYAMKAQSGLIDLARDEPDAVIARLRGGTGREGEILGVVLAVSGVQRAVPALIARYRGATDGRERAAAAEALGLLAGAERRPRPSGSAAEIRRDADLLQTWYREQAEQAEERSSVPPGPAPEGGR